MNQKFPKCFYEVTLAKIERQKQISEDDLLLEVHQKTLEERVQ